LYQVKKRNQPKTPAYHTLHSLSLLAAQHPLPIKLALSLSFLTLSIFDHTNRVLLLLLKLLVPIPRPLPRSPTKVKGGAVKIVNYSTNFNLTGGESAKQTKGKRAKCLVPPPPNSANHNISLSIYIYKIKPMDRR
jgi:hypothetical protein